MRYGTQTNKLNAYNKVGAQSKMENASPHRIIQMLLEGALEKIAIAKGHVQRKQTGDAGSHISWAISIIDGLRMSLDKSVESDITTNLDNLYDYMGRRLLEANKEQSVAYLDEVSELLKTIQSAWDQIPEEAKNAHQQRGKQG